MRRIVKRAPTAAIFAAAVTVVLSSPGCSGRKQLIEQQRMEITSLQGRLSAMETKWNAEKQRADRLSGELERSLADYREEKQVLLDRISTKSIITVSDAALFRSGGTTLTDTGKEILGRIGDVIDRYPDREILVEGHTDNVQIAPQFRDRYKSNWELSSARANSALHYMRENYNVPPNRLAAVGYGEYRPVADNAIPEGRAMNRRVVIVIGPVMEDLPVASSGEASIEPVP